jgi:hypothetical protein
MIQSIGPNSKKGVSMATADDVIKIAEGELGYYAPSDPQPGSKYGRWLADKWNEHWLAGPSSEIWWCCCFVSWVLDKADQACAGFPTYNTDLALGGGARNLCVNRNTIRRGDILIFDWNWGTAATDHIGFAKGSIHDGYVSTIEGNVGNAVQNKTRDVGTIRYVIRPPYVGTTPAPKPEDKLDIDGWIGPASVSKWQSQLGTTIDGVVSGQWRGNQAYLARLVSVEWDASGSEMVKAIQRKLGGLQIDGILGPESIKAIQRFAGAEIDGYLGPKTAEAIQRNLNENKWK